MRCSPLALRATASLAFAASPLASAHVTLFEATLTGDQATPPSITAATGTAEMHYDDETNMIEQLHIFTEGIVLENLVQADIRIGAPGVAGPVAFTIQNIWWGPGATGILLIVHVVGPISELDEAAMMAGNAYINIATTSRPEGEIRGQLIPAPGVAGALGLGAAAFGLRRRR